MTFYEPINIVSDTDLKTAARKMTEYLNGQGANKPVETHPYEFREWEPKVKEAIGNQKEMEQEGIEYLKEKYETVVQVDEDGNITELSEEPTI
jgi:hypothetical protein